MPCLCLWHAVFFEGFEKTKNNVSPIKECGILSVMNLSVFWMVNWLNRTVPRTEPLGFFEILVQILTAIAMCSSPWIIFSALKNTNKGKYPGSEIALLSLYGFFVYIWLIVLH